MGELWNESVKAQKKGVGKEGKRKMNSVGETEEEKQINQNAMRSTKLVQEGQFSRATKALTSRGIDSTPRKPKLR